MVYLLACWQQFQQNIPVKHMVKPFALLKANGRTPADFSGARICNQVALSHHSQERLYHLSAYPRVSLWS